MIRDCGLELLRVIRLAQRDQYIDNSGNLCCTVNPIFDDEKERLMRCIDKENRKKLIEEGTLTKNGKRKFKAGVLLKRKK